MTSTELERSADTGRSKQWVRFWIILAALTLLGVIVAVFLLLPLAMATDACYQDSTECIERHSTERMVS